MIGWLHSALSNEWEGGPINKEIPDYSRFSKAVIIQSLSKSWLIGAMIPLTKAAMCPFLAAAPFLWPKSPVATRGRGAESQGSGVSGAVAMDGREPDISRRSRNLVGIPWYPHLYPFVVMLQTV